MPPGGQAAAKAVTKNLRPALKRLLKAGHKDLVDDAVKQIAKGGGKSAERQAVKQAQRRAANRSILKKVARASKNGDDPLKHIPKSAEKRVLHPVPGKVKDGVEYTWKEGVPPNSRTYKVRVHGPDASAPAGSNAAKGPVYVVEEGGRVFDGAGKMHPGGVLNKRSPFYDDKIADDVHIPWPGGKNTYPRS